MNQWSPFLYNTDFLGQQNVLQQSEQFSPADFNYYNPLSGFLAMDNSSWYHNFNNSIFPLGQQYSAYASDQFEPVTSDREHDQEQEQDQEQEEEQDEGEIIEDEDETPSYTPTEIASNISTGRGDNEPTTFNNTLSDGIFVLNVHDENELRNLFSETDRAKIRRIVKRGKGWLAHFASPAEATRILAAAPAALTGRPKYGQPNIQPAHDRPTRKEAIAAQYDPAQPLLLGINGVGDSRRPTQPNIITPDKSANEEKASRLRAKLIAMRANTPIRQTSAALELISGNLPSTSTDIDSLVEQGRAAAAAANAAKATSQAKVAAHSSKTAKSKLPGLVATNEVNHGGPGGEAREQAPLLTHELLEYQKLEKLSSRLQPLSETARDGEEVPIETPNTQSNGASETSQAHVDLPAKVPVDQHELKSSVDPQRRVTQHVKKDPDRRPQTRAEVASVPPHQSPELTPQPEARSDIQATQPMTQAENMHARAYINNVADHITLDELRDALSKSAEITYVDINRQKQCALIKFATSTQYQAALASNPHEVRGERLYVEDHYVLPVSVQRDLVADDRLGQHHANVQNQNATQRPASHLGMEPNRSAIPHTPVQPARPSSVAKDVGHEEVAVNGLPTRRTNSGRDKDVDDWLELTGFYDEEFRQPRLARHRKLKILKLQVAELEREAQLEGTYALRAQSVQPMEDVKSTTTVTMPPPPPPDKYRNGNVPYHPNATPSKHLSPTSAPADSNTPLVPKQTSSDRIKRPHSPNWEPIRGTMPPEKLMRTERPAQDSQYRIRGTVDRGRSPARRGESVRPPSPDRSKYYRARSASPKNSIPLERRISWPDVEDEKMPTVGGRGQYEDRAVRLGDPSFRRDDRSSVDHRHHDSYDHQARNYRGGSHMRRDSMSFRDGGRYRRFR